MRPATIATTLVLLAGTAAAADFEGVIDSRITLTGKGQEEGGGGTARLYVSGAGSRMETEMHSSMGPMKMTVLYLKAKPRVTYLVNDQKKSYAEMELPQAKPGKDDEPEKLTVKKLASEKVAGYDCAHAMLTGEKGERTEIWATKAIAGAEAFWAAQAGEDRAGNRKMKAMIKTLREAGIDGWPLKFRSFPDQGQSVTWEATKVERKSLPASLFSLAGYQKSEGGMGAMGQMQLSPEQQKQLDEAMRRQQEAMKKMTPEQRKQMEEMMKSLQGGGAK